MPHGRAGVPGQGVHAHELALLTEELDHAHGAAGFVRLSGEPWVGKTRLALRLARAAAHRGWAVACGRAARDGTGRPFHALVDALDDQLAAADPAALQRLGPARLRVLAQVFPALGGSVPHGSVPHGSVPGSSVPGGSVPHGPPEADVHAVARALRAVLEELAGRRGLLLVLDDAHRAGWEVAEFAEHLLRHPPDAPVLTVLVHRGSGPGAGRLASLAHPDGAVRHIPLRPLAREAAAALLPEGLAPLHRELVLRDAEGVPGLLRALSDGEPPDAAGVPHSSLELACGPSPLAPSAPALDLGALSPLARLAADAAAAAGDPFTVETVAHTAPLPLGLALRAVDELHSEGILVPDPRAGWSRFRRPAARALVHQAAGAAQRRAARERALTAPDTAKDTGHAVLALLETAGPPTAAQAALLESYARATVFTQPARAERAARRAAERPGAPPGPQLLCCQALVLCGRPAQALTAYARLWPRQEAAPSSATTERADTAVWTEAAVWRARALRLLGARPQARRVLRAVSAGDRAAVPAAQAELAALLLESGRQARGAALGAARRAVRCAPESDVAAHSHALALLAAAHAAQGAREAAREAAGEAGPLLSGLGPREAAPVVEAWRWLGEAVADGDARRAREFFRHGFGLALHHGQGHLLGPFALGLARACLDYGEPAAAARHARFAAAEFDRLTAYDSAAAARDLLEFIGRGPERNPENDSGIPLSTREREIAMLIGPGLTNKQIAARMNISVKTVETHLGRIFKKLGVRSRAEVVFRLGIPAAGFPSPDEECGPAARRPATVRSPAPGGHPPGSG
ncbi:LuxR C-terminal-related transcriptional regulator [Streptomyces sp. NPDC058108]|uniref:helix-turn-helix transcriptional regulator n=1 Tax=Streptomyces sp. NPDC058108 TaxID=3346344 RepID=UPI0036E20076